MMERQKRVLILTNELLGGGIFRDIAILISEEYDMRITTPTKYTMKKIRQSGLFDCVIDLTGGTDGYDKFALTNNYIDYTILIDLQATALMTTVLQYSDFRNHVIYTESDKICADKDFVFVNVEDDKAIYEKAIMGGFNNSYIVNPNTYWGATIYHITKNKLNLCTDIKIFEEMYKINLMRFIVELIKREVEK